MLESKQILQFIFAEIGAHPTDRQLIDAIEACDTVRLKLLSAIGDPGMRELALVEFDEKVAECVRRLTAMTALIEAGLQADARRH